MKKRFEYIDEFIKEMAELYHENFENFNSRTVNHALRKFHMSEYDKQPCTYEEIEDFNFLTPGIPLKRAFLPKKDEVDENNWFSEMGFFGYFSKWCSEAGNNIIREKNPENTYFWYFTNPKFKVYEKKHSGKNPIKLYLPVGKKTFAKVIPSLFQYLNDNDVMHCSKIAGGVRNDDLVVRVYNLHDAEQLIGFVNENFENEILEVNPFTFQEGVVGITSDGKHSYNDKISRYITEYIKKCEGKNVSYEAFRKYILDKIVDGEIRDDDENSILHILSIALDPEATIMDYYDYWDKITDKKTNSSEKTLTERLEARKEDEIAEKSELQISCSKITDELAEKRRIGFQIMQEMMEIAERNREENLALKKKMETFFTGLWYLAFNFGGSIIEKYKELINTGSFSDIQNFIDETIARYEEEKKRQKEKTEENIRKIKEEAAAKIKAEREAYEELKKDPIRFKAYQEDQKAKRKAAQEEKAKIVSYLRKLSKSLDDEITNDENTQLNQNIKRVLGHID